MFQSLTTLVSFGLLVTAIVLFLQDTFPETSSLTPVFDFTLGIWISLIVLAAVYSLILQFKDKTYRSIMGYRFPIVLVFLAFNLLLRHFRQDLLAVIFLSLSTFTSTTLYRSLRSMQQSRSLFQIMFVHLMVYTFCPNRGRFLSSEPGASCKLSWLYNRISIWDNLVSSTI